MPKRRLHIAAYDVANPTRLRKALNEVKAYATGGQKSVYECFLTRTERTALLASMAVLLDADEDRFFLLRLETRSAARTMGIAVRPVDPNYFYVG